MAEPAKQRMSLAAFLEWDDGTDTRYELVDGRPRAMAPPIEAHGTIVANIACAIGNRLRRSGRVVVGTGIVPAERADTWYQADLVVTCAPAERGARAVAEPRLIVEVLSPTTEAWDRGDKSEQYRQRESLQEYVLIAQDRPHVERYSRQPDGQWLLFINDDAGFNTGRLSGGWELQITVKAKTGKDKKDKKHKK